MAHQLRYIFNNYKETDLEFARFIEMEGHDYDDIIKTINEDDMLSVMELYNNYKKIYSYFDNWILIKANEDYTEIADIIVKKKEENHIETYKW